MLVSSLVGFLACCIILLHPQSLQDSRCKQRQKKITPQINVPCYLNTQEKDSLPFHDDDYLIDIQSISALLFLCLVTTTPKTEIAG